MHHVSLSVATQLLTIKTTMGQSAKKHSSLRLTPNFQLPAASRTSALVLMSRKGKETSSRRGKQKIKNKGNTVSPARRIPIFLALCCTWEKRILQCGHCSSSSASRPCKRGEWKRPAPWTQRWLHQCDILRNIVPVRKPVGVCLCFGGLFENEAHLGHIFTSSRPPPRWTSVFHFSLFLYDVWPWETWSVIYPLCCWER